METGVVSVSVQCRYLVHLPVSIDASTLLVLTLHGYSQNPEVMLRLTVPAVGREHVVVSIQGPFQHYLELGPDAQVGYNWGTKPHHAEAVQLHQEIVRRVRDEVCERYGISRSRTVLMGFSQPVGFNYRLIGADPDAVAGVIAICGGVPADWEEPKYREFSTPVLHISRSEDEVFPLAVAERFPERLSAHAKNVEFHMLPGGHRFPSNAPTYIRPWLERVFRRTERSPDRG